MLNNAILLKNGVEDLKRSTPIDHEVFRDDLKPIHDRLVRQDVPVMWHPQADSDSVLSESIIGVGRHIK
jgi:hypothetical protein